MTQGHTVVPMKSETTCGSIVVGSPDSAMVTVPRAPWDHELGRTASQIRSHKATRVLITAFLPYPRPFPRDNRGTRNRTSAQRGSTGKDSRGLPLHRAAEIPPLIAYPRCGPRHLPHP